MTDWKKLIDGATQVAKIAIPLAGGAGVPVAAGIIIARKAADLIDAMTPENGPTPPADLIAAREELDRLMNRNVDDAIAALDPAERD